MEGEQIHGNESSNILSADGDRSEVLSVERENSPREDNSEIMSTKGDNSPKGDNSEVPAGSQSEDAELLGKSFEEPAAMDTTQTETKESVTMDTGKLEVEGRTEELKVEAEKQMESSSGEGQSGVDSAQV